jgi:outer membrane autotransporter protein
LGSDQHSRTRSGSVGVLAAGLCLGAPAAAFAQNATWVGGHIFDLNEWGENNNWNPAAVPSGTATFANTASTTTVANGNGTVTIGAISFTSNALGYFINIDNAFTVNGTGVSNASTNSQAIHVTSGNSLVFQNSSAGNLGTGTVSYTSTAGFITFNNTSNAGNINTIYNSSGVIQFRDSSSAGSATIGNGAFFSSGEMDFFNSTTAGSANVSNFDGGTITFNDNAAAANAIIGNVGAVNFNNLSTAGSAAITSRGAITFANSATAGSATITNEAIGSITFKDTSTAGSATLINPVSGAIYFNDSSRAGNATIGNGVTLQFNNLADAQSATIYNNGTASFNNSSTANTATIINNLGTLTFNDAATAGSASITTNTGGPVTFNGGSTGGTASFVFGGTGSMVVNALTMTAGSIASSSGGSSIQLNNSLTVGGNNTSTTFAGAINGDAGLTKVGTGTLTLSGISTYTGATTIGGGTLSVIGQVNLSSGVAINLGGTLNGTGSVSAVSVNSGGTLMPGLPGSIGTLTIRGNLVLSAAAVYLVQVSPTAASVTYVTGLANLGGVVTAIANGGNYTIGQKYTLLTATGGISGTFSGIAGTFSPALRPTLAYDANDVFLVLNPATLASLLPPSSPANVFNVAAAIDSFIAAGGALPPGFANIFNLSPQQIGNALTQLSGEAGTGALQGGFQMPSAFLSLLLDPDVDERGGGFGPAVPFAPERDALPPEIALAYAKVLKAPKASNVPMAPAAAAPSWNVWGAAFGGGNSTSGDPGGAGSHDTSTHAGGFAAGADYRLSPDTVVGFALAGGGSAWSLSGGLGGGRSDVFLGGVYGSRHFGAGYLSGALSYGSSWVSTSRTVMVAGTDQLSASFLAQDLGGRLEGGYRIASALAFGITPYGALQAQEFRVPAYGENATSGSPQFALTYNAKTATAVRTELGSRADKTFRLTDGNALKLFGRLAWAHDWQSDPSLNATFLGLPTASFVVNGAVPPHDLLLLTAGAEWRLRKGWSLLAKFDGEFADSSTTYAGTARVKYTW